MNDNKITSFAVKFHYIYWPVQSSHQMCIGEPTNTHVVARDSNISHHLNPSIYSLTIIIVIIKYTLNMIVLHEWSQIWCLALPN